MGYESNSGLNVKNHYGPRGTEAGVASGGELHGQGGSTFDKVVYITGDDFDGSTAFNTELTIPANSIIKEAIFEVTEAFTLGNADNVFNIGTDGSESTNGVSLAEPDALGASKDDTPAGTWGAPLTADVAVGVSVTGTTAAVTAGLGKAKVVIRYSKI